MARALQLVVWVWGAPPLLAPPPPSPARAAVRWRDGVTVPWQPLRQRAATKDTTRREVSARGGDVNPHLGRGSLLVWCVPWWAGHLAMCKVGPAGRWSTPPRRPRVLRGAVVEVAPGAVLCPPCIIARVGLESPHCRGGGKGHPTAGGGSAWNRPSWPQTCGWDPLDARPP